MALFGRRGHQVDGEAAAVLALIGEHAPQLLPGAVLEPGSGDLLVPVQGGRARVATGPLVDKVRAQPESARVEMVRRWLAEIAGELADRPTSPPGGAPASEALRLRVMPAWEPEPLAVVTSSPVPGTFDALVVYAADDRLVYLPREQAAAFGGEGDAASTAARQTITEELLDVDVRDHDLAGHRVRMIAKDGCPYVTTVLLSVPRFLPVPTDNALVIAPLYSAVALFPVTAKAQIPLAATLAGLAADMHTSGADSCSPSVYWWHAGTFHMLSIDDQATVAIPAELTEVVAALPD